ncbi:MAG: ABC transporter permease, partial [Planctomycetota bacterium]
EVIEGLNRGGGFRADTPEHWAMLLEDELNRSLPADRAGAARALVDRGLVHQAILFGPEFARRAYTVDAEALFDSDAGPLADGDLPALDVTLYSRENGGPSGAIRAAASGLIRARIGRLKMCRNPRAASFLPGVCDQIAAEGLAEPRVAPLSVEPEDGGVVSDVYDELVPGYTTMFVFFLVNLMARSFLAEQDLGTLRRLRTMPIAPISILVGKTLPFFVISLLQTAMLFFAGKLFFGMSWGPQPWLLLPIIVSCSAAATGLGLLVATLVDKEAQVSAYATSTVILLAGISGCFMPRDWLPETVQSLSLATPHAWALIGYDQALAVPEPSLGRIAECVFVLFGFAAGFLGLGAWRFGQRSF